MLLLCYSFSQIFQKCYIYIYIYIYIYMILIYFRHRYCSCFSRCSLRLSWVSVGGVSGATGVDCGCCPWAQPTGIVYERNQTICQLLFLKLIPFPTLWYSLGFLCRAVVSYYELLGVKPTATLEEIKHAFFAKSKEVCALVSAVDAVA